MTKNTEIKQATANGRALINKLNNFEVFLSSVPQTITDTSIITKLQMHLNGIKDISEKYEDVHIQLDVLAAPADGNLIEPIEFYNKYVDLYSRAKHMLDQHSPRPNNDESSGSSSSNTSLPASVIGVNAKLPRITLPSYDGNYVAFASYHETFLSLIHNNPTISDVEKFLYLQSSLTGVAAQTISNIQPSAENYKIAFDLICERYNNPKLIILSHIKGIFDLKSLSKRNAIELRKLNDDFLKHIRALKNLSIPVDSCGSFIYYIILSKLDSDTKAKLTEYKPNCVPTLEEITEFLKKHCQLLEEVDANNKGSNNFSSNNVQGSNKNSFKGKQGNFQQTLMVTPDNISCPNCKSNHFITQCSKFLALSAKQKFDKARELQLCKNCLRHSSQGSCNSRYNCNVCHKRHHTLLHFNLAKNNANSPANTSPAVVQNNDSAETTENSAPAASQALSCFKGKTQETLLSTVSLKIRSSNNKWYDARAILDSGSHVNFITEELADKLQLKKQYAITQILGINSCAAESNSIVQIRIASMQNAFQTSLQCLIIPKISENLPFKSFDKTCLDIPTNVRLADNNFNQSLPVDILIGASHFYNLMCLGQIQLGKDKPILQKTLLGWVVSGPVQSKQGSCEPTQSYLAIESSDVPNDYISNQSLENAIQKFWNIEEVIPQNPLAKLSREERFCEEHFIQTISRAPDGRFIVSIPFNSNLSKIGNSEIQATDRFLHLEKRLLKRPELKCEYSKFINEYVAMGHMTKITSISECSSFEKIDTINSSIAVSDIPAVYLPHHAVIKTTSLTTKLCVVFDGSAKSGSNISINNAQIVGPVVQKDLFSILLQFRQHRIALTGDIEKMYRQILVRPAERKFQRIFWRENPEFQIDTYELNTVTYGTASASYLATKCLQYLADLYANQFPKTSNILKNNFYMDDLLSGGDTVEEVLQTQNELIDILASAGFPIRKFLSNDSSILTNNTNCSSTFHTIPLGERESAKTLGITWNSYLDVIQYDISINSSITTSKRTILSMVAQLFDPLGLLSPIIIVGKLLIQKLWQLQLSWDEGIPENLHSEWNLFKTELPVLNTLRVPRWVFSENSMSFELHGFSDSSSKAYGACIYVRCTDSQGNVSVQLLCAKSRVAPLRNTTIPRLELCAALLLANLTQKVKDSLTIQFQFIYLWSDSTIVLNWINSAPNKYKTFVANRIAAIQEVSNATDWYHISSKQNPADLVSRGSSAADLATNSLWWHGPSFLKLPLTQWPEQPNFRCDDQHSEFKTDVNVAMNFLNTQVSNIFDQFSCLTKLKRIVAWIQRFTKNSKLPKERRTYGNLQPFELQEALNCLIKLCQAEAFPQELKRLKSQKALKTNSAILSLSPFLDETGIIRVGGRIKNSNFSFNKKFPILLPKGHTFTKLIFEHQHMLLLHCGSQHLLAAIRESYWPISGRNTAKRITHNCTKCFRANPRSYHPLMAPLPAKRLQSDIPVFSHVGVDYAGPILIKDRKLRGSKLIKSYICLFVCLVSRAIHLELVTSLTTDAFIAVLKRFISRRGKPISISSDNAANFRGAANHLKELYAFLKSKENKNRISSFMANQHVKWEFITPRSPHQGGIWESGVKSVKLHLKKTLGNASLNYEDFSTLLTQIEAILNSRPLSPLSADPLDTTPLTPGHFLIHRSFTTIPEANLDYLNENRLSLYQRIQRIVQGFWRLWSREVVPELQRKTKWFNCLPELVKIDSLVLVKEDNLPPLQWLLGRVVDLHSSDDGVVRSVTLRMSNGQTMKRSIHNVCALPSE